MGCDAAPITPPGRKGGRCRLAAGAGRVRGTPETCRLQTNPINGVAPSLKRGGWRKLMKRHVTLAVIGAAAIVASSVLATSSAFAAPPPPAPHYKPLICIFLPSLSVCTPPKPVMHPMHNMKPKPKP